MRHINTSKEAHRHKVIRQNDIGPAELVRLQGIMRQAKRNPPQEITQETIDRAMEEYRARQEK